MIPLEIAKFRPGTCTEIKFINGTYYVYMYNSVRLASGNWGKKTNRAIFSVPNRGTAVSFRAKP